jgi:hypothetical protein
MRKDAVLTMGAARDTLVKGCKPVGMPLNKTDMVSIVW